MPRPRPHGVRRSVKSYRGRYYRFAQGDFDVLVLSDGFITVPGDVVLPDASAAQRASFLGRLDTVDGAVRSKTNIPVLRRGGEVILVDTGSGRKYQLTDGRLGANLEGAGIKAADVTRVVFTHAHPRPHLGHDRRRRQPDVPERHLLRRSGRMGLLDGSGRPERVARRPARV